MSTDAQMHRNQHTAKVKSEIVRLQNAVVAIEQQTTDYPEWDYVGDWASLAQDMNDIVYTAEQIAEQSNKWWKVVGPDDPQHLAAVEWSKSHKTEPHERNE